jgi:hypothetical protein
VAVIKEKNMGRAKKEYAKSGLWIQEAIKKPGALHKSLHVPKGEKIPAKKLEKATHSKNPTLRKRAILAETLKNLHHNKGGKIRVPSKKMSFKGSARSR